MLLSSLHVHGTEAALFTPLSFRHPRIISWKDVLLLAGAELIFFAVAGRGLWFWVCAEGSIDGTGVFLILLGRAGTDPQPGLLFTPPQL